jgi:hypothetical protein
MSNAVTWDEVMIGGAVIVGVGIVLGVGYYFLKVYADAWKH